MLRSGRNSNRVPCFDVRAFALDPHPSLSGCDEINLLGPTMVMLLRAGPRREARLGQALVFDVRVAIGQQFSYLRPIFRYEGRRVAQTSDFHIQSSYAVSTNRTMLRVMGKAAMLLKALWESLGHGATDPNSIDLYIVPFNFAIYGPCTRISKDCERGSTQS